MFCKCILFYPLEFVSNNSCCFLKFGCVVRIKMDIKCVDELMRGCGVIFNKRILAHSFRQINKDVVANSKGQEYLSIYLIECGVIFNKGILTNSITQINYKIVANSNGQEYMSIYVKGGTSSEGTLNNYSHMV